MADEIKEKCCTCTTPEITIKLNKQGPQGLTGPQGEQGFSPIIDVMEDTYDRYTLQITDIDKTFETPNLKAVIPAGGSDGQVLTKAGGEDGSVVWRELPEASTNTKGVVEIVEVSDFQPDPEDQSEYTDAYYRGAVTPEVLMGYLDGVWKDTLKYVTLDTEQTIEALKTFTPGVRIVGSVYVTNSLNSSGVSIDSTGVYGNNIALTLEGAGVRINQSETNSCEIGGSSITIGNEGPTKSRISFNSSSDLQVDKPNGRASILDTGNLENYIKPGENITISHIDGGGITVSSTGGGSGLPYPWEAEVEDDGKSLTIYNPNNAEVGTTTYNAIMLKVIDGVSYLALQKGRDNTGFYTQEDVVLTTNRVVGGEGINVVGSTTGVTLNVNSSEVDYELLRNLPTINGEVVIGHMTSEELHLPSQDTVDSLLNRIEELEQRVAQLEAGIDGGNA